MYEAKNYRTLGKNRPTIIGKHFNIPFSTIAETIRQ